ncbi:RNA binding protein [Rasamsonia emersonii CBS 393.64]|uniref:RNA binding protein n=1 Tax=Rasamsonia emersonii (strain ATCC 16479 / CBS 393.64 / IMI 116815) TaxID=1408163 RepID=A0A0F4YDS3_RASE3|nr:RNA binding protein [Rasamsonia emersonii CBS 393.64]KKA16309.1 RNA binding protein [Rasamsonia emersonii CBS 393.64]
MDRSLDEIIAERPSYRERVDLDRDWVHDKFEDDSDTPTYRRESRPRRGDRYSPERERGPTGARLRIENLHYDLTEDDLEDLFTRIGPVTRVSIVYDRAGRSEGIAYVTYKYIEDARTAIREFDGANAKGQPIRITLVSSGRGGRNPFDNIEKPKGSLFDRIERPRDRRSLSPESDSDRGRRRGKYGPRRSDVSKPPPDHIDRYVPGQRSPVRRGRRGERREAKRRTDSKGRPLVNGRPRKTQEELDQEMDDYWENANVGASNNTEKEAAAPEQTQEAAPPSNAAAGDVDIDMVE